MVIVATSLTISDLLSAMCFAYSLLTCVLSKTNRNTQDSKLKLDSFQCIVVVVMKRFAQNEVINQNMLLLSFKYDKCPFSDLGRQTAVYTCEG